MRVKDAGNDYGSDSNMPRPSAVGNLSEGDQPKEMEPVEETQKAVRLVNKVKGVLKKRVLKR